MLVTINGVDLTPHIPPKSYKVNSKKDYKSWEDGNNKEHRKYSPRRKVSGSFDINLYGYDNMTTEQFLTLWNSAVDNEVVTMGVFVLNENKFEAIEAYFEHEGKFHGEMNNGEYCDVMTVHIQEV